MGQIQYVGLDALNAQEKETVKRLSSEYSGRIERAVKDSIRMVVLAKANSKNDSKKKWSIEVRVDSPKMRFQIKKAHDWDLARATHEAFNAALDRAEHISKKNNAVWKTKERSLKKGGILNALFGFKRK